jgi:CheY-like chemotaxis protein
VQTILVIEDEFGTVEVLVAALEDEGYTVLSAANGRQGLERLEEGGIDLVVMGAAGWSRPGAKNDHHDERAERGAGARAVRRLREVPAQAVPRHGSGRSGPQDGPAVVS